MTVTVAYPGREGAHSAAACDRLFPDATELVPLPSFADVAEAAADGAVDFGVLPIESSLVGPVAETHDLLYTSSSLSIVGETVLPIRHCLVGPALVAVEEVECTPPVALDQCRALLTSVRWATAIAAATTADAAAKVAELGDPSVAAIASERAARRYGLTVLADNVGDNPEAYTRFVSLATYTRLDTNGGAPWRTAFSFVTDHAGRARARDRAIRAQDRHVSSSHARSPDAVALPLRRRPRRPPADPIVAETLAECAR